MYTFTFYEPNLFAWQGDQSGPGGPWVPYLKNIPYPSGPEILAQLPNILKPVPQQWQAEAKTRLENYGAEGWNQKKLAAPGVSGFASFSCFSCLG